MLLLSVTNHITAKCGGGAVAVGVAAGHLSVEFCFWIWHGSFYRRALWLRLLALALGLLGYSIYNIDAVDQALDISLPIFPGRSVSFA